MRLLSILFFLLLGFSSSVLAQSAEEAISHAQSLSLAFEKVADAIRPAVVNIQAVKRFKPQPGSQRGGQMRPMPHPRFQGPFGEFFGDDFFERFFNDQNPGRGRAQEGMGTGVIIDASGNIVTNNHVVGDFDEITVRLADKRSFKAEVIGTDPKTDLAIIRIKADNLSPAKLGDSDKLRVGEWVIAAGNPFGLDSSITVGVVSAKGRSNLGITDYEDFIQTDAAINPGNSGGPLLNLNGEVVGINAAIYSRSGGYMGIGFAIPSSMVKSVRDALLSKGRVVRGWLGVAIQDLDEELAKSFGYSSKKGALVGDVTAGSPAAKAGVKQADIITRYDGREVDDVTHLRQMVAATEPGKSVALTVMRDGSEKQLEVKVTEMQADEKIDRVPEDESSDIGMTVTKVTPEIAQQLDLDQPRGVVVTEVMPGSAAESAGIRERDVILNVNGTDVDDISGFKRLVNSKSVKEGVRLVVQSRGMQRFVILKGGM